MLQQELTFQDVFRVVKRRWVLIAIIAIVGGGAGYGISRMLPKRYTSQSLVLVQEPKVQEQYVTAVVTDTANQRLASLQQEVMSRTNLESLINEMNLYAKQRSSVPIDVLVQQLRTAITITAVEPMAQTRADNLPGFYISVDFDDPQTAQRICSKVTQMVLEADSKSGQAESVKTTEFLTNEIQDAKAKLDVQDARLQEFQREHSGSLPDQEQANLNLMSGLNSQFDASTEALNRAQQDKSLDESLLEQETSAWQASQSGSSPETLETQLAAEQNQLIVLKSKYTDDYPDVIKLKHDIANLQAKIADAQKKAPAPAKATPSAEPAEIQQLRAQVHEYDEEIARRTAQQADLQQQIRVYQDRIQATPSVDEESKEISRDHQAVLDTYNDLLKRRDQAAIATGSEQGEFQVLDPANLPDVPSFPKKRLFAAGGLAGGLALGFGLALLLEMQDTSLKSEHDIETVLHLPILAMIPTISAESQDAHVAQAAVFTAPQKRLGTSS